MNDADIIKYLAASIAHKEKVIQDLIRKLDEAKVDCEKYRDYWLEAGAALKKAQQTLKAHNIVILETVSK